MKVNLYLIIIIACIALLQCERSPLIQREGVILFTAGEVAILSNDKKVQVKRGDIIRQGMTIITGGQSFTTIGFDGEAVKIFEKSTVAFSTLVGDKDLGSQTTEIYVERGTLLSKISRKLIKEDSFKVSSQTTVAAVRGTEFLLSKGGNRDLVACYKGTVMVNHKEGKDADAILLHAGQMTYISTGKNLKAEPIPREVRRKYYENLKTSDAGKSEPPVATEKDVVIHGDKDANRVQANTGTAQTKEDSSMGKIGSIQTKGNTTRVKTGSVQTKGNAADAKTGTAQVKSEKLQNQSVAVPDRNIPASEKNNTAAVVEKKHELREKPKVALPEER